MPRPILFSTAFPRVPNLILQSALQRGFPVVLLPFALALFALLPTAGAVTPAPDGGYPNFNTAEGTDALFSLINGFQNTAIGCEALYNNTAGSANTATGAFALFHNTNGDYNTANGYHALLVNTTGTGNTAIGEQALVSNTAGFGNTATGADTLSGNITGGHNTANGFMALNQNTTGFCNTANGSHAINSNTTGNYNTATGLNALLANTTGTGNTANGVQTLQSNTIGIGNTATGLNALLRNTTGGSNIALGFSAGANLTTGSNNIDIGNVGVAGDANMIRIGKQGTQTRTFVAGIFGSTVASGVGVIVNSSGQLGTVLSSERFKEAIKPMDKASEAILSLQPVTFRYKQELDPNGVPQFGLIAEQVDKVNPDLVVRGEDGKVTTVRYEAVNAMLLNEFLKEHRKVESLERAVARQQKDFAVTIAQQQKQIEALTAAVQKVSEQIALSKPAPQLVANSQ